MIKKLFNLVLYSFGLRDSAEFEGLSKSTIDKIAEFIRYTACGCCSVAMNWTCYFILYYAVKLPSSISATVAWLVSTTVIFFINKLWVFQKHDRNVAAFFEFFGTRLATGILEVAFMTYTVDILGLNAVICKFIATAICTILNYLASKLVIFK